MKAFVCCTAPVLAVLLWSSGCSRPSEAQVVASLSESPEASTSGGGVAVERVMAGPPQREAVRVLTTQPSRIEAFEQTPLYPKVSGYVDEVRFDIGAEVEKDELLIRLRVPELGNEVQQKEALVAQAQAEVKQAEAAVVAAEAALKTAEAQVKHAAAGITRADAGYERWRSEYDRFQELAARGSVTGKLLDETFSQFRGAEATREEAAALAAAVAARLDEAKAKLEKAKADVEAARAREDVAEANLAHAKTMAAYTEIRAPYAAIVVARHADTGHYVHPANGSATPPLLVVARNDRVRIFADVPETEAALVETGDPVTVRVQALGGAEIPATVTRTSWALQPSNRSLRTEIELPNENGRLRPGMYATAEIELAASENALTVPATAIVREGRDALVCCIEAGKVVRKPIALGLRSGERVEVRSGLSGSETVVLARADTLREGQPVEIVQPKQ